MIVKRIKHVLLIYAIAAVFSVLAFQIPAINRSIVANGKEPAFILDAGHGKPDGGAVGKDGTTESDLNLSVTLKIADCLKKSEISYALTRETEDSIFSTGDTIHAKKVSDIKERIKIASQYAKVPFISIHMNTFPNESVNGTHVFFRSGDEASKELALKMQEAINNTLQAENPKSIKEIPKNVYLFSHIENPGILIECGFLSNPQELEKLKTEDYQFKLAEQIAKVLIDFESKKG